MFAIFHHYTKWSWDNLPKELTCSSHMTLDQQATAQIEYDAERRENDSDEQNHHADSQMECDTVDTFSSATPSTTGLLPSKLSDGKRVYRLQKRIEEALGQCRTLAFLTNDIPALETSAKWSQKLYSLFVYYLHGTQHAPNVPFHCQGWGSRIHFKQESFAPSRSKAKVQGPQAKKSKAEAKPTCRSEQADALSQVVKRQPGRPRLKRLQRKRPPLPRQVSSPVKQTMLKAAAVLRRGILY